MIEHTIKLLSRIGPQTQTQCKIPQTHTLKLQK